MRQMLLMMCLGTIFAGCATSKVASADRRNIEAEQDARIVRGLLDSMSSATYNFPANIPR